MTNDLRLDSTRFAFGWAGEPLVRNKLDIVGNELHRPSDGQPKQLEVVGTLTAAGCFASGLNGGEQQRDEREGTTTLKLARTQGWGLPRRVLKRRWTNSRAQGASRGFFEVGKRVLNS
jgi:hypothetical protein